MLNKISYIILSVAIVVTGVIAFRKLNYWDRSIRIFSFRSEAPFEGRMGRGPGGFEGRGEFRGRDRRERPEGFLEGYGRFEMHELPDSLRERFESGEGRLRMRNRDIPDSFRQQFGRTGQEGIQRTLAEEGFRNRNGHGRGEFQGGRKIRLRNVLWFLTVFASFAVLVIYIDKMYNLVRKRK